MNLIAGNISLNEFVSSDSMALLLEAMGLSALRAGIQQSREDVIRETSEKPRFRRAE